MAQAVIIRSSLGPRPKEHELIEPPHESAEVPVFVESNIAFVQWCLVTYADRSSSDHTKRCDCRSAPIQREGDWRCGSRYQRLSAVQTSFSLNPVQIHKRRRVEQEWADIEECADFHRREHYFA